MSKTLPPKTISKAQQRDLYAWHLEEFPHAWEHDTARAHFLRVAVLETLDYWRSEGKRKADWMATIRNRVRTLEKWRGFQPKGKEPDISAPSPQGKLPFESGAELEPIGKTLELFR